MYFRRLCPCHRFQLRTTSSRPWSFRLILFALVVMILNASMDESFCDTLEAQGAIDDTQTTPVGTRGISVSLCTARSNVFFVSFCREVRPKYGPAKLSCPRMYIYRMRAFLLRPKPLFSNVLSMPSSYQSSPIKRRTSHATHFNRTATTAAEAEEIVLTDICHAAFGNTPGFFDTLFSCDDLLIDQIYDDLTSGDQPLYSKANKCWTSLPTNPPNVDSIYEPLVTIFSAITAACGSAKMFNLFWQDVHSKKVNPEATADVKPDIIGLLQACDYDSFDPWRLIQTVVEVKEPLAVLPGLLRVLKYSRQVLYEQVDRRFIFGLVYAKTHLTVWLVDRSGALGSQSFNVHEVHRNRLSILLP